MKLSRSWPLFHPFLVKRSFPKGSLLHGTEPLIWDELGKLSPEKDFAGKKQVTIRKALDGVGLGWVATNTTPFRVVVGAFYDAALSSHKSIREEEEEAKESGSTPKGKQASTSMSDRNENENEKDTSPTPAPETKRQKTSHSDDDGNGNGTTKLDIVTSALPEKGKQELDAKLCGPLVSTDSDSNNNTKNAKQSITTLAVTKDMRKCVWDHLNQYGAYVIRQALTEEDVESLRPLVEAPTSTIAKPTKLASTMGNGVEGSPKSMYTTLSNKKKDIDILAALEGQIWDLLTGNGSPYNNDEDGENDLVCERKNILLQYGENSENWAHQDNNQEEVPIQAVLLLNQPDNDFRGGQFYVAKQKQQDEDDNENHEARMTPAEKDQTVVTIHRYEVEFQNCGDLVIFQAGKSTGWWHGILPVQAGSNTRKSHGHYVREAVGMLQPY